MIPFTNRADSQGKKKLNIGKTTTTFPLKIDFLKIGKSFFATSSAQFEAIFSLSIKFRFKDCQSWIRRLSTREFIIVKSIQWAILLHIFGLTIKLITGQSS